MWKGLGFLFTLALSFSMLSEVGGKNHNNKQTKTTSRIPTNWHLNMGRAVRSQWVGECDARGPWASGSSTPF